MSLSKPVVFGDAGSAPQYSFPRGVQLGFMIGVPIAVVAFGAWWVFKKVKKPLPKDEGSQKPSADGQTVDKKREDTRPIYVRLKEEGNECFKKADYGGALDFYAKAIKESPPPSDLANLLQNRAAVFEKLNDWVQVIHESTAALKLNPKYVKALSRRSKAYRQTGFLEEALEDITAVCVIESFTSPLSIQTADDVLKAIGQSEAERLIKEKKPCFPSNHSISAFLRAFYCDPVTRWWNDPSSQPLHNGDSTGETANMDGFAAALQALKARRYEGIIELCTDEIESGAGQYVDESYLLRGTFRHLWGYHDEVLEDLMKVAESKTASKELRASAYVKLGSQSALQDNEQYDEYFQRAEMLYPECVDIYHQRGQILLTKGLFEAAIVEINKANQICPDFALAAASKWYVEYRIAHFAQNEEGVSAALKNFNKCMRKFEKSPDVFNLHGQILMELGRFSEAIAQFDHVIELDPGNAAIYVHKAVAKYQMEGEITKVLELLYDSVKIDDRNEFVYETIGTLELQAGNLEKASIAISKALDLAKTFQELMMLSSLKKAAEIQAKVKSKYNMEIPSVASYGGLGY